MQPRRRRRAVPTAGPEEPAKSLAFGGLDALIGYRLRRAQVAAHRLFLARMSGLGLTQRQTAVLWLSHTNPGVAQGSIAAALGMDRATMMAVVDRLQDRGLVTRQRSTSDRRRQEVLVTPAGERILQRAQERIGELEADYRALYTPDELGNLLELLRRLRQGLESPRQKAPSQPDRKGSVPVPPPGDQV